jgi:ABC-type multidrug transport system ATPase subunit
VYFELIALARDHGKILVVISHDAELENFDRVIILDKGRVIGDHRGDDIAIAVQKISKDLAGDTVSS